MRESCLYMTFLFVFSWNQYSHILVIQISLSTLRILLISGTGWVSQNRYHFFTSSILLGAPALETLTMIPLLSEFSVSDSDRGKRNKIKTL